MKRVLVIVARILVEPPALVITGLVTLCGGLIARARWERHFREEGRAARKLSEGRGK